MNPFSFEVFFFLIFQSFVRIVDLFKGLRSLADPKNGPGECFLGGEKALARQARRHTEGVETLIG